jgi:hypothetical protein
MFAGRAMHRSAAFAMLLPGIAAAALIQFDEPYEGATRACADGVCITSTTPSVSRSVSGLVSLTDLLAPIPPILQGLASAYAQAYQTNQTIGVDLIDANGNVLNNLTVDFAVDQLAYHAGFAFTSDAGGPLPDGPLPNVLATGDYQDLALTLQAQLDLSGLPAEIAFLVDLFRGHFQPVQVSARSGPLGPPPGDDTREVPLPATCLLSAAGLVAWRARGRVLPPPRPLREHPS